jgi:hypothetical protein
MWLQIITILVFGTIAYQDVKERMVYWVLFPVSGFLLGAMHLKESSYTNFIISVSANILLVCSILLLLWIYFKIIKKQRFLNVSIGVGDILFFYAFALGFPIITFMILLISCFYFSLLAFVVLNFFVKAKTIPLAGFMCIFLIGILLISNLPGSVSLYLM